ncbi:MAG: CoA-binding protein [Deltaproteobacteria bacterium]|nr:CoA-binding protein [Deltaproteobacteria bacterium]
MSGNGSLELERLFYPKNVAFVGASPKRGSRGNRFMQSYIGQNFRGKIFPVHPSAKSVLGFTSYKRVRDIPDPVDLVIFAIPNSSVLPVIQDCAEKGVKFVHMYTAGFSETGRDEDIELEKEVIDIAKNGKVRLVGPNCMGLYCPEGRIAWSDDFPTEPGPIGFVSQSGQLAGQFIGEAKSYRLRFSKVVSFGNASDLQAHDFFNYLARDKKTKIIGSYLEGLKDGRAFFEFARGIARAKPLVVWKGGVTEGGARATRSHTASIAGSSKIWRALCRQAGIISVESMEELVATISALLRLELPDGPNAAIMGGAGGGSVTMTDVAEKEGLKVPHLSPESIRAFQEFVPISGTSVKNPLDIGGAFFRSGPDKLMTLYDILRDDPNIDALIFSQRMVRFGGRDVRGLLDVIVKSSLEGMKIMQKPCFIVLGSGDSLESEALHQEAQQKYNEAGIATFPTFRLAARVMSNLAVYKQYLSVNP